MPLSIQVALTAERAAFVVGIPRCRSFPRTLRQYRSGAVTCVATGKEACGENASNGIVADSVSMWWPDGTPVLRKVSLSVPHGKLAVLVGKNGCGKSTLMHVLSGYRLPDRGSVCVDQPLSYMHQDAQLQLFMPTVGSNLSISLPESRKDSGIDLDRKAIRKRCLQALESMDLCPPENYLFLPVRDLSGGEKQKVALAAALLCEPHALLFDEVTASMDERSRALVLRIVDSLVHEQNRSCLWYVISLYSRKVRQNLVSLHAYVYIHVCLF